jgi:ribosomal protein S18 acetylase RimI-like enzyme
MLPIIHECRNADPQQVWQRDRLAPMLLNRAVEAEYPAIIDLINLAFRGTGPSASWNTEVVFIEGQRLNESLLREDLAAKPEAHLLTYRDNPEGPLLGTVLLDPKKDGIWYLGLLTVRPDLQKRKLGRELLASAEDYAKERGARLIQMTVVNVRDTLIAWYERRGYTQTAETRPFPYGDDRFGKPLRDDLYFVVLEKTL